MKIFSFALVSILISVAAQAEGLFCRVDNPTAGYSFYLRVMHYESKTYDYWDPVLEIDNLQGHNITRFRIGHNLACSRSASDKRAMICSGSYNTPEESFLTSEIHDIVRMRWAGEEKKKFVKVWVNPEQISHVIKKGYVKSNVLWFPYDQCKVR